MAIGEKKGPYSGIIIFLLFMYVPSIIITAVFWRAFSLYQAGWDDTFNWACAKAAGFGVGSIYHITLLIVGVLKDDFAVVKNRVKEFFSDLKVTPKLAFTWYWNDIKENGVAYWIDLAAFLVHAVIFHDAFKTFLTMYLNSL